VQDDALRVGVEDVVLPVDHSQTLGLVLVDHVGGVGAHALANVFGQRIFDLLLLVVGIRVRIDHVLLLLRLQVLL